jgi:alpha-ribazole phosphatase
MDFGVWQGKPWSAVPRSELDAWAADVWGYRPGGGEGAQRVAQRWRRWSTRIQARDAAIVAAVTHAGFIRVALACEGHVSVDEFAHASIGFGSVHCLELRDIAGRACTPR